MILKTLSWFGLMAAVLIVASITAKAQDIDATIKAGPSIEGRTS